MADSRLNANPTLSDSHKRTHIFTLLGVDDRESQVVAREDCGEWNPCCVGNGPGFRHPKHTFLFTATVIRLAERLLLFPLPALSYLQSSGSSAQSTPQASSPTTVSTSHPSPDVTRSTSITIDHLATHGRRRSAGYFPQLPTENDLRYHGGNTDTHGLAAGDKGPVVSAGGGVGGPLHRVASTDELDPADTSSDLPYPGTTIHGGYAREVVDVDENESDDGA
ncbi:hypothetical protein HDU93_005415 [Gonapodya sp. JEL0774]|nr:hypothetical protein HDU93_005415 [Gonapodya sp. JEL0774]